MVRLRLESKLPILLIFSISILPFTAWSDTATPAAPTTTAAPAPAPAPALAPTTTTTTGFNGTNDYQRNQIHIRIGMLSGSFSGPANGSFSITNTLDGEYEIFSSAKASYTIRGIIAQSLSLQETLYSYIGMGRRYYFGRRGSSYTVSNDAIQITSESKFRYYGGFDAGISHVLLETFGDVLSATASMFDVGLNAGLIYQVSKGLGLEAQVGYTMGFGFSAVSASSTTTRLFFGVAIGL